MRFDLRILWVEDADEFYNTTREILEMYAEEKGIKLLFEYIKDIPTFVTSIERDKQGFRLFDMCFIDYNLSPNGYGSDLIRTLRKEEVSADILFYSSEYEKDIRDTITNDISSYEGVFIANRKNFEAKAYQIINKNARRLTSLTNVRGFLMDQTSENDFTIHSYIIERFRELTDEQRMEISGFVKDQISGALQKVNTEGKDEIQRIDKNGIVNVKKTLELTSALIPINFKYQIFKRMVEYLGKDDFDSVSIDEYISKIVKARNKLAHKKLDICREHKYIKYSDNIKQYIERKCPVECAQHDDCNKYSTKSWDEVRKKTIKFGEEIDDVQKRLLLDLDVANVCK